VKSGEERGCEFIIAETRTGGKRETLMEKPEQTLP